MRNQQTTHQHLVGIACPNCRSQMKVRTSRGITPLYRQQIFACKDPECGATYGAELAITHLISPSARPDPTLQLRTSPPRHRQPEVPANDTFPPVAPVRSPCGPEVPPSPANDEQLRDVM